MRPWDFIVSASAIKRRKEIWEALNPGEGGKTVPTLGGDQEVGFASDTAVSAGMTKRAINQHLARAEALGEQIPMPRSFAQFGQLQQRPQLSPSIANYRRRVYVHIHAYGVI